MKNETKEKDTEERGTSAVDALVMRLTDKMKDALLGALDTKEYRVHAHIATKMGLLDRGLVERKPCGDMHLWWLSDKGKNVAEYLNNNETWGCAYCNCKNKANAKECINCSKKKKVGSPFHFTFA